MSVYIILNIFDFGAPVPSAHDFFKDFIYLFMIDTERSRDISKGKRSRLHAGAEVGLNPGTPGSHPELKADSQLLSHP